MVSSDQLQSKKKLKPLQETQQYLQAALQSVIHAQAMENNRAHQETAQNIQMAQQTLTETLQNLNDDAKKKTCGNRPAATFKGPTKTSRSQTNILIK